MQREWVLITGASAGIGKEFASIFASQGYNLVLLARDKVRLTELAQELKTKHGIEAKVLAKDLGAPAAATEIFEELQREQIPIHILVNNAGFGWGGPFAQNDLPRYVEMIQVNITALVQLTHLFLKPMQARGAGRILNIASTAAFQPGPLMAIYYASKSFVFSFSYALANELAGSGVTVTTLCPGPTRSEFHARANTVRSERVIRKWMMDARAVAELGYLGLIRGKRVVIPGFLNKLGSLLGKCLPPRITASAARKVMEG